MTVESVMINGDELLDEPREITPNTKLTILFHEHTTELKFTETELVADRERLECIYNNPDYFTTGMRMDYGTFEDFLEYIDSTIVKEAGTCG